MTKFRTLFGLLLGASLVLSVVVSGQGPTPAVVQAAIRALLAGNNTWTGTNTFNNVVVNGSFTCPMCPETEPGGASGTLQYNDSGVFGGLTGSSVSGNDLTLPDALTVGGSVTTPSVLGATITFSDGVTLTLGADAVEVAAATIAPGTSSGDSDGADLTIHAGDSTDVEESAAAGTMTVRAGNGTYQGGDLFLQGGVGVDDNHNGSIFFHVGLGGALGTWAVRENDGGFGPSLPNMHLAPAEGNVGSDIGTIAAQWRTGYFSTALELGDGGALRSDTTDAHTAKICGYDVNGAAYVCPITITNANAPTFVLAPSGDLTVALTGNTSSAGAFIGTLTSPAVANIGANSCGTSPATIAGTDNVWTFTVGATAGTACRVTFDTTAPTIWKCQVSNQTTLTLAATPHQTGGSSTTADITGVFTAGDAIDGICIAR